MRNLDEFISVVFCCQQFFSFFPFVLFIIALCDMIIILDDKLYLIFNSFLYNTFPILSSTFIFYFIFLFSLLFCFFFWKRKKKFRFSKWVSIDDQGKKCDKTKKKRKKESEKVLLNESQKYIYIYVCILKKYFKWKLK